MGRKKYMISLIDDFIRYAEVNFLFKKSDASYVLQTFCEKINTQTKRYPRSFHSDQGGKYINAELTDYFESQGIQYLVTATYSAKFNGVAERYNQSLTNLVRPSLDNVPTSLWVEAFNWACYVKNRLPHSALIDKTPSEVLFQKKPTISHLRPFYTKCYVHIPEEKRAEGSKLDARALEGHLVGYTETTRMFRVYIPSQYKVDAYRQVKFEPSYYTSVDIHTPRPTPNNADQQILPHDYSRPTSPSDQLQSEVTQQQQQQTTTQSSSQFPGSYPETPVKPSSSALPPPPLRCTLVPPDTPPRDFLDYTQDSDSESERDPPDPLPGPSTPPH